jgi:hypothetical protein
MKKLEFHFIVIFAEILILFMETKLPQRFHFKKQ